MRKNILWCLLALFMVGCTDQEETKIRVKTDNYCQLDTAKERADFILQCVKDANPHSDEEPEDWIRMCQYMAEDTLCRNVDFEITYGREGSVWTELRRRPMTQITNEDD